MSRNWTLEQLNGVHPLPAGRAWLIDPVRGPVVTGNGMHIWVDSKGRLCADELCDGEDASVCLAVILASKGLDSRESMARRFAGQAKILVALALAEPEPVAAAEIMGNAHQAKIAAAKLQRGTWAP